MNLRLAKNPEMLNCGTSNCVTRKSGTVNPETVSVLPKMLTRKCHFIQLKKSFKF